MYRTASISAYDMLDRVHVSAQVMTYQWDTGGAPAAALNLSHTFDGRGEPNDWLWLAHALEDLAQCARARYNEGSQ